MALPFLPCFRSAGFADTDLAVSSRAGEYGTAEFAAGYSNEESPEEMPIAIEETNLAMASAEYSVLQKALFFAVIIGAVAMYVRWSKRKNDREGQGYEKSMA